MQMMSTSEKRHLHLISILRSVSFSLLNIKGASSGYLRQLTYRNMKLSEVHPTLASLWSLCPGEVVQGRVGGLYPVHWPLFLPSQAQRKHGKQSLVPWQRLHFWVCTRKCGRWHVISGKHTWKSENFAGENIFPSFIVLLCISCLLGNCCLMPLLYALRLCWLKCTKLLLLGLFFLLEAESLSSPGAFSLAQAS